MSGRVYSEVDGPIGWIFFDHQARRNAITSEMWGAIPEVFGSLDANPDVRVLVMRGAGDVTFVSGADISEFEARRRGDTAAEYDAQNARAFAALQKCSKPLIAMIHGFCVGGGCAIALNADLRYCAEDAVFAIPAARLGLGYAVAGLEALVNVVGFAAAKEIFFTARRFTSAEAYQRGLVHRILPKGDLEEYTRQAALDIAANAPLTVRSAKLVLTELAKPENARDKEAMIASIRECYASADYAEGVRAFLEKRRPQFSGS